MEKLVHALEQNGLVEDDDGPWGALIVLAAKAHQSHKHWSEYIWRLCVSYRLLNAVTRIFAFLSPRCDDAANMLGDARYFIVMDLPEIANKLFAEIWLDMMEFIEDTENLADIKAYDKVKGKKEKIFPSYIVDKIFIKEENPIKVYREYRNLTQL